MKIKIENVLKNILSLNVKTVFNLFLVINNIINNLAAIILNVFFVYEIVLRVVIFIYYIKNIMYFLYLNQKKKILTNLILYFSNLKIQFVQFKFKMEYFFFNNISLCNIIATLLVRVFLNCFHYYGSFGCSGIFLAVIPPSIGEDEGLFRGIVHNAENIESLVIKYKEPFLNHPNFEWPKYYIKIPSNDLSLLNDANLKLQKHYEKKVNFILNESIYGALYEVLNSYVLRITSYQKFVMDSKPNNDDLAEMSKVYSKVFLYKFYTLKFNDFFLILKDYSERIKSLEIKNVDDNILKTKYSDLFIKAQTIIKESECASINFFENNKDISVNDFNNRLKAINKLEIENFLAQENNLSFLRDRFYKKEPLKAIKYDDFRAISNLIFNTEKKKEMEALYFNIMKSEHCLLNEFAPKIYEKLTVNIRPDSKNK